MSKNKQVPGDWNVITDCCGMKRKFSQVIRQWDGLIVCPEHHDPRHPLDFIKPTHDDQRVPIARPESTPVYLYDTTGTVSTTNAVTNGTFATDTDWIKGDGWSIVGATAQCDGTQADETIFFQDGVFSPGLIYDVAFPLVGYTVGDIHIGYGASGVGITREANGTYTERITIIGNPYSRLSFVASSDFQGVLSSVTAYLVSY